MLTMLVDRFIWGIYLYMAFAPLVEVFKLTGLPSSLNLRRNKTPVGLRFPCNLNHYRNAHFRVLHEGKEMYEKYVSVLLRDQGIGKQPEVKGAFVLIYRLWSKDKRGFDISNVLSIVDKFTSDALVNCGIISDDNVSVICETRYRFMGIDSKNPRIELTVYREELNVGSFRLPTNRKEIDMSDVPFPDKSRFLKDVADEYDE